MLLLVSFFVLVSLSQGQVQTVGNGFHLKDIITDTYDKRVPPPEKPTTVTVSIHFSDVWWKENKMYTLLFLRNEWTDSRLSTPNGPLVRLTKKALDDIWVPDTFFTQAKSYALDGGVTLDTKTGNVMASRHLKVKSFCPLAYPHTGHTLNCTLNLESYIYPTEDMDLVWKGQPTYTPQTPRPGYATIDKISFSDGTTRLDTGEFKKLSVTIGLNTGVTREVADYLFKKVLQM